MFFEYAVEPAVLSSWDRVRFFLDAFGPWKGRFLAEYPRRWKKMVYDAALKCPDRERKQIEVRLANVDKRVFSRRSQADYDNAGSWFENAETEHRRVPFRAIIAAGARAGAHVLDGGEVDDRCDLWRVESGRLVSKDPASFARAIQLLLSASTRVVIIDPYFRADQDDKTRPLVAICKSLPPGASLEIHFSDKSHGYDWCMQVATRALPKVLPSDMKVTLYCWRERAGGPRLHNRYILTDVGGVKFGDSIEAGDSGEKDHLSILDEPSRAELWEQYLETPCAFDSAGLPQKFP
jgi:hypothetical protein